MAGQGDSVSQSPEKLQVLIAMLGTTISEFGNQPCFKPGDDVIVMPRREFFTNPHDYDVTLCHELIHWTGHSTRLDRATMKGYSHCEVTRAEEELIAEIGSVFLASYFGLAGDLINHASYVSSWKKILDAKAVGRAMSQASKAFNWLVSQLEDQSIEAAA